MTLQCTAAHPPAGGLAWAIRRLAQDKDQHAWAELLKHAGEDIGRLATRMTGDPAMADDVVQETLLLIRDHAGRFIPRDGDANLEAKRWILGITARTCLQMLRQSRRMVGRHRRAAEITKDALLPAPDPAELMQHSDVAMILRREMAALPSRYGQALALHYLSGQGYPALALHFQVPEATVRTRVNRGLKELRQRLTRCGMALSLVAVAGLLTRLGAETVAPMLISTSATSLLTSAAVPKTVFSATALSFLAAPGTIATGMISASLAAAVVFAVVVVHPPKLARAEVLPIVANAESGFTSLFNGIDLSGWSGDQDVWRVVDHTIVGSSFSGTAKNSYLITKKHHRDFVLRLEFKLVIAGGEVNSGVNYRSDMLPGTSLMSGYQADIGPSYTGNIYDQDRRNFNLVTPDAALRKRVDHVGDWNSYEVICRGTHMELRVNGVKTADYTERDAHIALDGLVGLQLQTANGGTGQVFFRNIRIQDLDPTASSTRSLLSVPERLSSGGALPGHTSAAHEGI